MAKRYYQSRRDRMDESRGMARRFSESGEYSEQEGRNKYMDHSEPHDFNKEAPRFNDEEHHDKDMSQDGFFRKPGEASYYMGMPSDMRKGLEKDEMIGEDHRAIANLPQEVMIKSYPRVGPYMPEPLEDSIVGVDAQMEYDDSMRAKHNYPKKH